MVYLDKPEFSLRQFLVSGRGQRLCTWLSRDLCQMDLKFEIAMFKIDCVGGIISVGRFSGESYVFNIKIYLKI